MVQRAFYLLHGSLDLDSLFRLTDHPMIEELRRIAAGSAAGELLDGLFGPTRRLYKRLAQFSFFQERELYEQLARRPYAWLSQCGEHFASVASTALGRRIAPHEVLFDSPPMKREVEFQVDIFFPKEQRYRPLSEVSPVVQSLTTGQFDDYVKRVRIFVHPRLAADLRAAPNLSELIAEAIRRMG
jgi:uncharacterized protein